MLFKRLKSFRPRGANEWVYFLVFALVFIFFMVGTRYVDFPDEYVNVLAGKSILRGGLPYRDFWDHHLPGAWYIASALLLFSGKSFVVFRLLYALIVFVSFGALARWIYRRAPDIFPYYLGFLLMYPLAGLYFWFHLYLADSLAVWFFSLAFWMIFVSWSQQKTRITSLYAASALVFLMIFSSTTYLYIGMGLYGWIALLAHQTSEHRPRWNMFHRHARSWVWSLLKLIGVFAAPYVLYGLYVAVTGSWGDMLFANFTYNTTYYISIPNFVRGAGFNPIVFATTLAANFYEGYLPLLSKIKHLDLYLPIGTMAGLGTLLMLILLAKRNILVGVLYLVILTFSAPRSDVESYKETDYQMSMFLVLGMASTMMVLYMMRKLDGHGLEQDLKRLGRVVLAVFALFTFVFLGVNMYNKAYQMYTQKLPMIHNRGFTAEFFDDVLDPGQQYFVGPYEPQDLFYPATDYIGKHPSLLPQFREGAELRASFIADMERIDPAVVVYRQEASVFGTPSLEFGEFFLDWMSDKYTRLEKIDDVEVLRSPSTFSMSSDLYLRKDIQADLLNRLEEKGYVKVAQP